MNGMIRILKKFDNESWNDAILRLHDPENIEIINQIFIKDLLMMKYLHHF